MPHSNLGRKRKHRHELTEMGAAMSKRQRSQGQHQWDWQGTMHEQERVYGAVSEMSLHFNKETTPQEVRQNSGDSVISPALDTSGTGNVPPVSCAQNLQDPPQLQSKVRKDHVCVHGHEDFTADGLLLNWSENFGYQCGNERLDYKRPVPVDTIVTFDGKETVGSLDSSEETNMSQKEQQDQLQVEEDLFVSVSGIRGKSCEQEVVREVGSQETAPECTTSVSEQVAQADCIIVDNEDKHSVRETIAELRAVQEQILQQLRRQRKVKAMSSEEKVQLKECRKKMHNLQKIEKQQKKCHSLQNLCSQWQRAVRESGSPETVPKRTTSVSERPVQANCINVDDDDDDDDDEHAVPETIAELQILVQSVNHKMQRVKRGRKMKALNNEEEIQWRCYKKKMRKLQKALREKKRCQSMENLHSQLHQHQRQNGEALSAGSVAAQAEASKGNGDMYSKYYSETAKLSTELEEVVCKIQALKSSKKRIKGGARKQLKDLTKQENQLRNRLGQIRNCQKRLFRESSVGMQGVDPFSVLGKVSQVLAAWRQRKHTDACLAEQDLQSLDLQQLFGDMKDQQEGEDLEIVEGSEGQQQEQKDEVIGVSDEEVDLETRQSYSYLASKYLVNRTPKEWRQLQKEEDKRRQQQQIASEIDRCVGESAVKADINQSYFLIAGLASVLLSQQRCLKGVQRGDLTDLQHSARLEEESSLRSGQELGVWWEGSRQQREWEQQEARQKSVALAWSKKSAACCNLIAKIALCLKMTPQQCLEEKRRRQQMALAKWQRQQQQQQQHRAVEV